MDLGESGNCTVCRPASRLLRPGTLMVALCAHGAKHHWQRLSWLCDIERLARTPGFDWQSAARDAAALRCAPALLLGCLLAADLLDAPVPANVLEGARSNPAIRDLFGKVRQLRP